MVAAHSWHPPRTYPVTMEAVGVSEHLGSVGFRTVEVDRSDGGFRLYVNGIRVYCRGSVWVPTDPISLQGDAGTTRVLERLAEAGLNMIRIPGTMVYESDHFWEECARLGILVWQDMMLATLDPPDTDEFFELVASEVTEFLHRVRGNPALAVFCGGSETEQQPTMLGLVDQHIPLIHSRLPELISTVAPELEYVTSSPPRRLAGGRAIGNACRKRGGRSLLRGWVPIVVHWPTCSAREYVLRPNHWHFRFHRRMP